MKQKTKLKLMQVGGFATTFLPLSIGIGINWQDYISTTGSIVSLTVGGATAAAIVVIQMLGRGKNFLGNGVVVSGILFALMILLEPIILNLKFLTGLMFAGEGGYALLFKNKISSMKKDLDYNSQARVLKEVLRSSEPNSGRV